MSASLIILMRRATAAVNIVNAGYSVVASFPLYIATRIRVRQRYNHLYILIKKNVFQVTYLKKKSYFCILSIAQFFISDAPLPCRITSKKKLAMEMVLPPRRIERARDSGFVLL